MKTPDKKSFPGIDVSKTVAFDNDPTLTNCGRMAKQTWRLTFQTWKHAVQHDVTIGGNCKGLSVASSAVSVLYDNLPEDRGCPYIMVGTCQCHDEDDEGSEFLEKMLVKAELVSIEPEARK